MPWVVVIDLGSTCYVTGHEQSCDWRCLSLEAIHIASAITPFPRGVGPFTVSMLLSNSVEAAKRINGLKKHNSYNNSFLRNTYKCDISSLPLVKFYEKNVLVLFQLFLLVECS